MGTWYVVHMSRCFLCSGTSQSTYPGQMQAKEPYWQLGWGSWGSALGRSNPQLLDHSWHWSYQHRGCQAEPAFGAGSPYREKRLQSLAQLGALASHGALSPIHQWEMHALASTHTHVLVKTVPTAPTRLFPHFRQVNVSSSRRKRVHLLA